MARGKMLVIRGGARPENNVASRAHHIRRVRVSHRAVRYRTEVHSVRVVISDGEIGLDALFALLLSAALIGLGIGLLVTTAGSRPLGSLAVVTAAAAAFADGVAARGVMARRVAMHEKDRVVASRGQAAVSLIGKLEDGQGLAALQRKITGREQLAVYRATAN